MPQLLPDRYTIVLAHEGTGRILRRATLSRKTAETICGLVDGAAEFGGKVAQIVDAGRVLERAAGDALEIVQRAFAPLAKTGRPPRKLPARRRR